jgi:hypothetical protein
VKGGDAHGDEEEGCQDQEEGCQEGHQEDREEVSGFGRIDLD